MDYLKKLGFKSKEIRHYGAFVEIANYRKEFASFSEARNAAREIANDIRKNCKSLVGYKISAVDEDYFEWYYI